MELIFVVVLRRPSWGQKQTLKRLDPMSALPTPEADIAEGQLDVRFVPQADILRAAETGASSARASGIGGTLQAKCSTDWS